ncbi:unnamed protein product [Ilex paraguariensis]|uniref:Uncharacterized protein n=1 Tax=Ilex paraguariensis TaxID=185542 RepID=A0ABC8UQJ8_9AQUA
MAKRMQGFALDSSSYGPYEGAKTRFKHQALMQDYQELQKESDAMRNKLETMKLRKLALLAEVRFLRQRYKHLLKNKSPNPPQEQKRMQQQNTENQIKSIVMNGIHSKKEAALCKLPLIFNHKQKGRMYAGKQASLRNVATTFEASHVQSSHDGIEAALRNATPSLDFSDKLILRSGKEPFLHHLTPPSDLEHMRSVYRAKGVLQTPMVVNNLNQKGRINGGNDAAPWNPAPPIFNLNQKESSIGGKELGRAPIFDLNQISGEEEDFQNNSELSRIEEPMNDSSRGDEHLNDLKLSACRNIEDGSARVRKGKISWQDPVALRV